MDRSGAVFSRAALEGIAQAVRGHECLVVSDDIYEKLLYQGEFLNIVADLVGERNARRHCALLLTSAHGIASMEISGYLDTGKWHTTADELVDTLVRMVTDAGEIP